MNNRAARAAASCAVALLVASTARADGSEAERLFVEGRALMLEGRFAEACPKLAESNRLEPHVGTLLNLAACDERSGKVATAWVEYQKAATAARAEGQKDRAGLAQKRIDALAGRVPWLTLAVAPASDVEGLKVLLDGGEVAKVAWGTAMPVDPGTHAASASAPGRAPFERSFDLAEGERTTIDVDLAVPAPAPAPVPPPNPDTVVVQPTPAQGSPPPVPPQPSAEPKPAPSPAPPAPRPRGDLVVEGSVLFGFAEIHGNRVSASNAGSISIETNANPPMVSSCAGSSGCSYALSSAAGAFTGVDLFVGAAVSEQAYVGGRLLLGPMLGHDSGTVFALGPSVTTHAGGPFWLGATLLLGAGFMSGQGAVTAPAPFYTSTTALAPLSANTDVSIGAAADIHLKIVDLPRGSLGANLTPFFLVGSGFVASVSVGLAYRFR